MINLTTASGSINQIIATLSCDNIPVPSGSFVFTIQSAEQNNPQSFILTDVSNYPCRYNEFYLSGSAITLPEGLYQYTFTQSGSLYELGKCMITEPTQSVYAYSGFDNTPRYVYNH